MDFMTLVMVAGVAWLVMFVVGAYVLGREYPSNGGRPVDASRASWTSSAMQDAMGEGE
jgi:hypothetical protein